MNSAKNLENTGDMAVEKERKLTMAQPFKSHAVELIICFLGIFVSYFIYGILQEKITKSTYGEDEEKFTFTLAMVFFQCIVNGLFAEVGIWYFTPGRDTAPQTMYAAMSFSYLGAMLASNHALQFITYPTQVLGKSVKPIPVMILGVLYAHKRYPLQKYLFVLLIVVGVALFTYKDNKRGGLDTDHTLGWGEILLIVSLTLDGMTGAIQEKIRSNYQTQTYRMMLYINLWSVMYLSAALLVTGEGLEFLHFASRFPSILLALFSFSILSAVGQIFIFMTVTKFGPLTCSIMTTTRKFFTILGSVIIFAHPMSGRQWFGTMFVFAGLSLDSAYGREKRLASRH